MKNDPKHPWKGRVMPPTLLLNALRGTSGPDAGAAGPEAVVERKELHRKVVEALKILPPMCFRVVKACYIDEKTIDEVMKELDLNRTQVKNFLEMGTAMLARSPKARRILEDFLTSPRPVS